MSWYRDIGDWQPCIFTWYRIVTVHTHLCSVRPLWLQLSEFIVQKYFLILQRRIRMVLVEGKLRSWGRAELVIKLLDHDLPAAYSSQGITNGEDYYCTLEDVVEAVRNCEDKRSALVYLMQECQICFSHYPMSKVRVSLDYSEYCTSKDFFMLSSKLCHEIIPLKP